jgi:pectate lyase
MGLALASAACATSATAPSAAAGKPGAATVAPATAVGSPIGFAAVDAPEQRATTGGGDLAPIEVSSDGQLWDLARSDTPQVIRIMRSMSGSLDIGSHKTIEGAPGVSFTGHIEINGSANVILREIKIIGYNCIDRSPCKKGDDAITISNGANHIWLDHCDISDGSDGNLDITDAADYITISWTKFWYSAPRPSGHRFCNLIGNDDVMASDAGHLRVTFHHDWWADNVQQRMPRVRFGQVHVFNSLYSSRGNDYCVGLGADAAILLENNAFVGVKNPAETNKYASPASVLVARGNLFRETIGTTPIADHGTGIFTPPYAYQLEPATAVQAEVMAHAGPTQHAGHATPPVVAPAPPPPPAAAPLPPPPSDAGE